MSGSHGLFRNSRDQVMNSLVTAVMEGFLQYICSFNNLSHLGSDGYKSEHIGVALSIKISTLYVLERISYINRKNGLVDLMAACCHGKR